MKRGKMIKYNLRIYLNDEKKTTTHLIGEYDSIEKAREERKKILEKGYLDMSPQDTFGLQKEHYYPPYSIIKISILPIKKL